LEELLPVEIGACCQQHSVNRAETKGIFKLFTTGIALFHGKLLCSWQE
jgi:hypothetical protein